MKTTTTTDKNQNLECNETTENVKTNAPTSRRRSTPEERLQKALEKKKAMECKIEALQSHVDERARTKRNRGLILTGLVVEQCFFNSDFNKIQKVNRDWWVKQADSLNERDKAAYLEFLESLP